ncbi:MAG: divalent-cation tolerance protein CutA, partial [Cyanobacteria bacterium P01_A01_bin.135]
MSLEEQAILVLVTAGSQADADIIATALVEQRLAACVAIAPIQSIYRWQGKIERDSEWQLTIKTAASQLATVQELVQQLHPYDVPEVLAVPVMGGSEDYLTWLLGQVGQE